MDNSDLANDPDSSGGMMVKCIFLFVEAEKEIYQTTRMLPTLPRLGNWATIITEDATMLVGIVSRFDWVLDNRPSSDQGYVGDYAIANIEVTTEKRSQRIGVKDALQGQG